MNSQLPPNEKRYEENIPPENANESPINTRITAEQVAQMKALAREQAIQQAMLNRMQIQEQNQTAFVPKQAPQQKIVYVRRNLTVAEVIVVFAISCGIVLGIPAAWNFGSNLLPRIEIKVN